MVEDEKNASKIEQEQQWTRQGEKTSFASTQ